MNWKEENNKLQKSFEFDNFKKALDFVNEVGTIAERSQHHPDISIHDYNKVDISLTTHDKGEVTDKDHLMADGIDKIK
jgi:4a-hydroxytetrahydrobiopterin dehydratase